MDGLKEEKSTKTDLIFNNGAQWFISFYQEEIGRQLVFNAMKTPEVFCGMNVQEIVIQENPEFSTKENFFLSSPVLIGKYDENRKATHLTYKDPESEQYLTETIIRKLKSIDLDYDINIKFDKDYHKAMTKLVTMKGIKNKTSMCPVIIEGNPKAISFAWNVGIGHSTGSGFGAIL